MRALGFPVGKLARMLVVLLAWACPHVARANPTWWREIALEGEINGLHSLDDGYFAFGSLADFTTAAPTEAWVARLDSAGLPLRQTTIRLDGEHIFLLGGVRMDREWFLVGTSTRDDEGQLVTRPVIAVVDDALALTRPIVRLDAEGVGGLRCARSPGGDFVVAGRDGVMTWVASFGPDLVPRWERKLGDRNDQLRPSAVALAQDGRILVAGWNNDVPAWPILVELSPDGSVNWVTKLGMQEPSSAAINDAFVNADGTWTVVGSVSRSNPARKERLQVHLDRSGGVLAAGSVTSDHDLRVGPTCPSSTGGFLSVIWPQERANPANILVWAVETDMRGRMRWSQSITLDGVSNGPSNWRIARADTGGYLLSAAWFVGRYMHASEAAVVSAACAPLPVVPAASEVLTLSTSVQRLVVMPTSSPVTHLAGSLVDVAPPVTDFCPGEPCPSPLAVVEARPSATACAGRRIVLAGTGAGEGSVTLEWDLDYDGTFVPDASGPEFELVQAAAGTRTVALRVTDGCASGIPALAQVTVEWTDCAIPPGEVSDVRGGRPPLLCFKDSLLAESLPEATSLNLRIGDIGSWSAPGADTCHRTDWQERPGQVLALPLTLAPNTWVLVTASNSVGEGDAGRDSRGIERDPSWISCGPTP